MGDFRAKSGSGDDRPRPTSGLLGPVLVLLVTVLGGCSTSLGPVLDQAVKQTPAKPQMSAANLREHQRILAAYGGAYSNPRLEPLLAQTDRKSTRLNSSHL